MRFGILGPLELRTDDGTPLDPGGPRPRALLTLLLLDAGHGVSLERLTDGLYGAEPPAGTANALQSQISRLRRRLAPHTGIEATSAGYRVTTPPDTVDAHHFEQLTAEGRAARTAPGTPRGPPPCCGETPFVLTSLEQLDDTDDDLYFGSIAQIHVDRLTKGRVALLGDAGYGSTMGGMGTGVAVVGAYVLAGELALAGGDHRRAFAAYEALIRPFAQGCQKISGNTGPFFAPATERRIRSRDRMYRVLGSRPLARFFKRLTEKAAADITLPAYPGAVLG